MTRAKQFRARIVRDDDTDRPDQEMDFMCEIGLPDDRYDRDDMIIDLIMSTSAWKLVETMCEETETDVPDLWDNGDLRDHWIESIKGEMLIKSIYLENMQPLVAHTTPKLCEKLGVSWDNAAKAMDGEVRMFWQWSAGEVYGYIIEEGTTCDHCTNTEWEVVDSCFGFYGSDIETNGMLDNVPSDMREVLRNAAWGN
jgi:hypothetical protein